MPHFADFMYKTNPLHRHHDDNRKSFVYILSSAVVFHPRICLTSTTVCSLLNLLKTISVRTFICAGRTDRPNAIHAFVSLSGW